MRTSVKTMAPMGIREVSMRALARRVVSVSLVAMVSVMASCVQVLGDYKPAGTGGSATTSSGHGPTSGSATSGSSGAATSTGSSSSSSSGAPPVAGRPGSDLTSGGQISTSASYKLIGAVSESPGQNQGSSSPSHKVVTGIIGTTQ
jgi:hypothetical protein